MSAQNSNSGGITFSGILFLVFLVLKLVGTINWSWWWVTSPLWIVAVITLIFRIIIRMNK